MYHVGALDGNGKVRRGIKGMRARNSAAMLPGFVDQLKQASC